jgi:hypothetical protein
MARAAVTTKPVLDAGLSFSDHMTTESMPPGRRWLRNPKGRVTVSRSARRRRVPIGCGSPTIARLGPEVTPVTAGSRVGSAAFAAAASRAYPAGTHASSARTRPRRSPAWPRGRARPALGGCDRPGRRRRRAQGGGSSPVTQPVSGRCPRSCGRFEEHRLPELVVAAAAGDPDVPLAAAAPGRLPRWLAEARRPAHLHLAGPQLVTEWTGLRLVFEHRNGHLNDHAPTSCHESMITVTCTDDRADRTPAGPSTSPGWPGALALGAGQPRPILGEADPAIAFIASPLVSAAPPYREPRDRWRGSRTRQQPGVRRASSEGTRAKLM